jgi:hypothetical protein
MTDLRDAARQALEALKTSQHATQEKFDDLRFMAHSSQKTAVAITALSAALEQPEQTCNCRWVGDVQTQQCTLHEAHIAAIHEWAERAKAAEAKLAALEQPEQKDVPAFLRAAFERHAKSLGYSVDPDTREGREGGYWSSHTHLMWETWQAALEQQEPDATEQAQAHAAAFIRGHDAGWQSATAHRAALAQPEQEPVAWACFKNGELQTELVGTEADVDFWCASDEPEMRGVVKVALYTHPPRRTGLPHCERSCEANAFQIEIRRLTGEVWMLQEQNTELDRKLAAEANARAAIKKAEGKV